MVGDLNEVARAATLRVRKGSGLDRGLRAVLQAPPGSARSRAPPAVPRPTGIAQNVRPTHATAGWQRSAGNFFPRPTCHVVFTLPRELAPLDLQNKKVVYGLLPAPSRLPCCEKQGGRHWRTPPQHSVPFGSAQKLILPTNVYQREIWPLVDVLCPNSVEVGSMVGAANWLRFMTFWASARIMILTRSLTTNVL